MEFASSSTKLPRYYDVLINFNGEDIRRKFVSHLDFALSSVGLTTFLHHQNVVESMHVQQPILNLCRVVIIVFTKTYSESAWCLHQLQQIIQWHQTYCRHILPVYYEIQPSDVRLQKGDFGKALKATAHQTFSAQQLEHGMSRWSHALTKAANFFGWDESNHRVDADSGIRVLMERNLIKVKRNNKFGMHPLLQEMGIAIFREISGERRWKNGQLLFDGDAEYALKVNAERKDYEVLPVLLSTRREPSRLPKGGVNSENLYPKLRWISFRGFSIEYLPNYFNADDTIAIDLKHSLLQFFLEEPQDNSWDDIAPLLGNLANLRTVLVQCDTEFQLSKQVKNILVDYFSNITESEISKQHFRSSLIGVGAYHEFFNAVSNNISEVLASSESSDVSLPGDNPPYWLAYMGQGDSVSFTVPPDNSMKGMFLCVFNVSTPEIVASEGFRSVLIVNYTKCTLQIHMHGKIISFNDIDWKAIRSNLGSGDKVEIFVTFSQGVVVKNTHVYLIFGESHYLEKVPTPKKNDLLRFIKKIVK
ncbi:hypothetical protein LR48_Vigan521s001000 [Vigna angularis]|uniref:TIR domain-containing protein n=1 Tax=Phaseolus angularis TaxID=3914 RepID=A0A0L9TCS3_PHAAN|nr:hypothetical protein LR48_Vigan521s001000 [Vigna angularis]